MGEWLRGQSEESLEALRRLNVELVAWILAHAEPHRLWHGGLREFFYDDTQLEVFGRCFEGARINYEGKLALSWETLWMGCLLLNQHLGSPGDCDSQLVSMLKEHHGFWRGQQAHFYADSASSDGRALEAIEAQGWHYTVSYNKWTAPLERKAQEFAKDYWKSVGESQYALMRHQPEGCQKPKLFACARHKDGLLWQHGFVACDPMQGDAASVFERHHLKGDRERLFSEVLSGLDLHHPPCSSLMANRIYYVLATLAYNLLQAIKLLELTDDCQGWRVKTLMKKMVFLPARMQRCSRQLVARLMVPASWLEWWRRLLSRLWPALARGRPPSLAASA